MKAKGREAGAAPEMKSSIGPVGRFLGTVLFSLLWNGILSVFLVALVKGFQSGEKPWFMALFLLPFVVIGLGALAAQVYFFLALFNPRPVLTLTPPSIPLGGSGRLSWTIGGSAGRIHKLTVIVEGREEARYQQGTTTHTARSVFFRATLAEGDQYGGVRRGSAAVTIPAEGTVPSFKAKHNEIIWVVKVKGEIVRWPDVGEEFPFKVLPHEELAGAT